MSNFSVLSSIYYKENPGHFNLFMQSIWEQQTLPPTEMVLVEDGILTNELYKQIDIWKNRLGDKFKIVKLPQNVGTGKAKNIGLQNCTYDIVCIADTDDIYISNCFEKQLNFLDQHPEITIVGGQLYEFIDNIQNVVSKRILPSQHEDLIIFAQKRSPFNNMTIAYRKKDILNVGGYQHHLWMEDYNLFLRLIAKGYKLHNLPDFLVYARIDNGMHIRRRGWKYVKSEKQLFDLKINLKIQPYFPAAILFLFRSLFRLLPSRLLALIYKIFLRTNAF